MEIVAIISNIILGSGLISITINQIIKQNQRKKTQEKVKKYIAREIFDNEKILKMISEDFDHLNETSYMNIYQKKFKSNFINSVIAAGLFFYLNEKMINFLIEYKRLIEGIQNHIDISFDALKNSIKMNDPYLKSEMLRGKSTCMMLIGFLENEKIYNDLKFKYHDDYEKELKT